MKLDNYRNQISQIAKKVILRMSQKKIPLLPENYHIWFEYFSGNNERLMAEIDQIAAQGISFSDDMNQNIYKKHFGNNKNKQIIKKIQREAQKIFKAIFNEVIATNKFTSDYESKLREYVKKLDGADDLSEMQQIVEDIITDTNRMAESSHHFKEKLEDTKMDVVQLRQRLAEKEREILIDPLTGLHNRKALETKLKELFEKYQQDKNEFSAIMVDIDFFKNFNDKFGHKIGDEVLQIVGSVLHDSLKGRDLPARYGGEEFLILLPGTPLDTAAIIAEQLRKNIMRKKLKFKKTGQKIGRITVSLGVAVINFSDTIDSFMERADKALYKAKKSGRNIVVTEIKIFNPARKTNNGIEPVYKGYEATAPG